MIAAIPISTQPPGGEADNDPSMGACASAPRTRAGKQKATTNLTPQKKAKKVVGKSLGGLMINEPAPMIPASTPPSGPRKGITIL
jgi:hypothetical protein